MKCYDCGLEPCLCFDFLDILDKYVELESDLAELEASKRPNAKRCKKCANYLCTCGARK